MGEHAQRSSSNALGLQHTHTGNVVTLVAGTNTNRYRIQSNDPLSMTLVLEQLVARLQSRYPGSYVATIGQNHLQLVQSQIEAHFAARQRVKRITVSLSLQHRYVTHVNLFLRFPNFLAHPQSTFPIAINQAKVRQKCQLNSCGNFSLSISFTDRKIKKITRKRFTSRWPKVNNF